MSLHPLKHLSLIFQSNIKIAPSPNFSTSQKSVGTNTIIKSDNYNVLLGGYNETQATVVGIRVRIKATALNINKHRQGLSFFGVCRGVDVQKEAILRVTGGIGSCGR